MKRAYSINEFCQVFECGRTKTYQEINAGRLIAVKIGSKTVIRADDAERWLANLKGADQAISEKVPAVAGSSVSNP